MEIIIFTNLGQTYMFNNCTDINITESKIEFRYFGESTQVYRNASFPFTSCAGYALRDPKEEALRTQEAAKI